MLCERAEDVKVRTVETKASMMKMLAEESGVAYGDIERLPKMRYDMGKYEPSGKGRPAETATPVWYESRCDKHGKFIVIYSFNVYSMSGKQMEVYKKIKEAWNNV